MSDRIADIWEDINQPLTHRIIGAVIVGLSVAVATYGTHVILVSIFGDSTFLPIISVILSAGPAVLGTYYILHKLNM